MVVVSSELNWEHTVDYLDVKCSDTVLSLVIYSTPFISAAYLGNT